MNLFERSEMHEMQLKTANAHPMKVNSRSAKINPVLASNDLSDTRTYLSHTMHSGRWMPTGNSKNITREPGTSEAATVSPSH
jgi:hypothetical protein